MKIIFLFLSVISIHCYAMQDRYCNQEVHNIFFGSKQYHREAFEHALRNNKSDNSDAEKRKTDDNEEKSAESSVDFERSLHHEQNGNELNSITVGLCVDLDLTGIGQIYSSKFHNKEILNAMFGINRGSFYDAVRNRPKNQGIGETLTSSDIDMVADSISKEAVIKPTSSEDKKQTLGDEDGVEYSPEIGGDNDTDEREEANKTRRSISEKSKKRKQQEDDSDESPPKQKKRKTSSKRDDIGRKRAKKSQIMAPEITRSGKYKCLYANEINGKKCGIKFSHRPNYGRHVNRTHTHKKTHPCLKCGKICYSSGDLADHTYFCCGETKPHVCACGRDFLRRHLLATHKKKCAISRQYYKTDDS